MRRRLLPLLLLGVASLLAACAGDVNKPTAVQAMDPARRADLRIVDITAAVRQGVVMTPSDLARMVEQVRAEIGAKYPAAMQPPVPGSTQARLHMEFTLYDEGNAFARFMLAGLGQIHIEADVAMVDAASGQPLARWQVSKTFAFGGLYGGTTNIQDVEKGFARSVAEVMNEKL